jgi:hypothetical protein
MNNEISIKQAEHHHSPQDPLLKDLELTIWTVFRFPVLALILLYQKTLSRALPGNTCIIPGNLQIRSTPGRADGQLANSSLQSIFPGRF